MHQPCAATSDTLPSTTARAGRPSRDALPWSPLLALALAGFICIMTETLPVGLLPQIADDLDVSRAAAGQWVSVYAAGTAIAVLPVIALTRGLRRKPLLCVSTAGFLVANVFTAVAPTYEVALVARAIAGAFSGLTWGMLAGYARGLAPSHLSGRALAVALLGTPLALSLGTPLGTLLGGLIGWRWAFAAMSVVALGLIAWTVLGVPDRPGQGRADRLPVWRVMALPGVVPVLLTTLAWLLAHNILYTYVAPYVSWVDIGARVDVALLVFGVSALVGIWFTGRLIDRALRMLVLGSLLAFAATGLALAIGGHAPEIFWSAVVVWGLTFGGAATQLTTAAADAAGSAVDIAQALMVVAFNVAIFGGGVVGGLLLDTAGPGSFPWAVGILSIASLIVASLARRHSFIPGPRS